MSSNARFLAKQTVAIHQFGSANYTTPEELIPHLRAFGQEFGWATATNAFGSIIPSGSRVLVKPNLVLHENNGPWSYDAVITHPSLIQAVVSELLHTNAGAVSVGDSPIQSCDFQHLMRRTKLDVWSANLMTRDPRFTGVH